MEKIKDILVRTFKTFIQGFIGALAVTLPNADYTDEAFIKSAIIGALAGGVCAVMNLIIKALDDFKNNELKHTDTFEEDEDIDGFNEEE